MDPDVRRRLRARGRARRVALRQQSVTKRSAEVEAQIVHLRGLLEQHRRSQFANVRGGYHSLASADGAYIEQTLREIAKLERLCG